MKKLDPKQLPQFIALGVLTAGVGGYTVYHFAAPSPVSADTRPAAAATTPGKSGPVKPGASPAAPGSPAALTAAAVPGAVTGDAPPPSPTMRDPFAPGYVDPTTLHTAASGAAIPALPKLSGKQTAGMGFVSPLPVGLPLAPALPGSAPTGLMPALPVGPAAPPLPAAIAAAPPAPTWTVTGVLQGVGGKVAILRSGEARRIVRSGDFVDSTYRVAGVSRTAVVLRHGLFVYQLKLGGFKAAPSAPMTMPSSPPPAAPRTQIPAVLGSTIIPVSPIIPVYHVARPHAPLAHLTRQGPGPMLAAGTLSIPHLQAASHAASAPSAAKVAGSISLGLRLLDGSVLTPRKE